MNRMPKVDRGSGNVFADLGFSKAEAENLKLLVLLNVIAKDPRAVLRAVEKARARRLNARDLRGWPA